MPSIWASPVPFCSFLGSFLDWFAFYRYISSFTTGLTSCLVRFFSLNSLVFRLCKVPPRYENTLNNVAMNLLGIGVLIHIGFCSWIFSNPEIFPTEIKSLTSNNITYYYYDPLDTIEDRIFSTNGLPFFILLCAGFAALFIFSPFI